jgi:conjugal transfer pilus assembly protein TraK
VLGKISQKEVTRISFERGRIRKVTGNAGEFVLEKDEEKGQIFIRPVSPDSTKPINLFITSERSTSPCCCNRSIPRATPSSSARGAIR